MFQVVDSARAATSKSIRECSTRPQLAGWREVRGCLQENNERRRSIAGTPREMASCTEPSQSTRLKKGRLLRRCNTTSECRPARTLMDHFTKANHLDGNTHIAPITYHVYYTPNSLQHSIESHGLKATHYSSEGLGWVPDRSGRTLSATTLYPYDMRREQDCNTSGHCPYTRLLCIGGLRLDSR